SAAARSAPARRRRGRSHAAACRRRASPSCRREPRSRRKPPPRRRVTGRCASSASRACRRARATCSSSRHWPGSPSSTGISPASAASTATRLRRRRCAAPSPRRGSRDASRLPANGRRSGSAPPIARPISSCCPPGTRATAWPSPRRWRMACRSSAPPPARFPTRCRRRPGCSCRRATPRRWRRRCAASSATLRCGAASPRGPRAPARRCPIGRWRCGAGAMPSTASSPEPAMSGFALDWLKLRERYDCAARDPGLTRRFAAALPARPRLVDLGAGAGANLRYLAPRLGDGQRWLLVDSDERLLAAALEGPAPPGAVDVEARRLDLARDLGRLDLAACDGIVANALLDLVSAEWLTALVAKAAAAPRPLLLTLTVDGRSVWQPLAADDALVA